MTLPTPLTRLNLTTPPRRGHPHTRVFRRVWRDGAVTDLTMHWAAGLKRWVTIPDDGGAQ